MAFQLSAQGLLRLSDEQLILRAHLLHDAIFASDEAACASQLLGDAPEQTQRLLANLSDASLHAWSKLAAQASAASLREEPRHVPTKADVQEAFRRLLASLPAAEAKQLATALADPTDLGHADACRTTRKIYQTFVELPAQEQGLVARVFAIQ